MATTSAAHDSTVVKPAEVALQQLLTNLRCYVCTKLPKNTHICPACSEMYCYLCVYRLVTTGWKRRNKCSKCRAPLQLEQLIKLRCFETLDDISVDLARLSLNDASSSPPVVVASPGGSGTSAVNSDAMDFVGETKVISVGRQEPVQGLPAAVQGTFTLRNVHQCRLPWVFSERIVDEMGFMWRLRVSPKGENQQQSSAMMDVYVEMLHGEPGFFEIMLELTNITPRAYLILTEVDTETMAGKDMFLANDWLPRGNFNLNFRYTIRPASYRAKVLLQQRLIHKHAQQMETMKGNSNTFTYCIYNYEAADLQDESFESFTDQLECVWRVGIHGKHDFTEFLLILDSGLPGSYEITFILTHPTPSSEKRLHYAKRNIQINQRNLFNFGVRWNELNKYGFVHNPDDMIKVKITIRPLQVDLKRVQQELANSDDGDDDDDEDEDDDEYYNDDEYDNYEYYDEESESEDTGDYYYY